MHKREIDYSRPQKINFIGSAEASLRLAESLLESPAKSLRQKFIHSVCCTTHRVDFIRLKIFLIFRFVVNLLRHADDSSNRDNKSHIARNDGNKKGKIVRARRFKTQADIDRYIAQGAGRGEGDTYQPWLRVQDVPSKGRSRKILGSKTGRLHHLLSDAEYYYLLLLEFSERVVDIREGFPIFPTQEAQKIAAELGIRYPRYKSTTLPFVMTTDFMVTIEENGRRRLAARTVKTDDELIEPTKLKRRLELFELEKEILSSQGVDDWSIVTPNAIGESLTHNLKWLHPSTKIDSEILGLGFQNQFLETLDLYTSQQLKTSSLIRLVTGRTNMSYSDGVNLFKYLIWSKAIQFDIANQELHMGKICPPLNLITPKQIGNVHQKAA